MSVPQTPGVYWGRWREDSPEGPWTLVIHVTGEAPFLSAAPFVVDDHASLSPNPNRPSPASRFVFGPRIERPPVNSPAA